MWINFFWVAPSDVGDQKKKKTKSRKHKNLCHKIFYYKVVVLLD